MISAEQIISSDITENLSSFDKLGGIIYFKFFKVTGTGSVERAHLLIAQKTLELLGYDFNTYLKVTYRPLRPGEGNQIAPKEFFGPYFNLETQRPILQGKAGKLFNGIRVFSDFFYYDDPETPDKIVPLPSYPDSGYITHGYADAFLAPPHSFGGKMTNFEIGRYFLHLNDFFFDDLDRIVVYAWPTDCSNYFDDGKEFWGSFFWTVYNPIKDWYIGIAASATD